MFHSGSQLAPFDVYLRRQVKHLAAALVVVAVALGAGVAGYHWIAGLGWIDAFLNASMILSGMGPVDCLTTAGAKLFASLYALFGGLIFIVTMGVVLAPLVHRLLHRLHIEEGRRLKKSGGSNRESGGTDSDPEEDSEEGER